VAAGALAGALALGGCGLSLQSLPKYSASLGPTYPLHVTFADVLNLPADAQVRVGPLVVGSVSSISTRNFAADLVLEIKDGTRVPAGTTAQIRFDNPLGDEYILLTPPPATAGPNLAPGAAIAEADTSIAPSVEDTLGALSTVLNGGGINQLQTIVHQLNLTFTGNQPQLRSLLAGINAAVTSLAGGRAAVDNALSAMGNLSKSLNGGSSTIAAGIDSISPAVAVLSSEDTQIDQLFGSLDQLASVANDVTAQSGTDAVNDIQHLVPVADQLASVDTSVGPDLADLGQLETSLPKAIPGDYLQVGVKVNVILPSGDFSPAPTTPTATVLRPASGAQSVAALLETGLA
jgi:phospholipid/cholesterol/gamma-HCH transport system substrate-binding protein